MTMTTNEPAHLVMARDFMARKGLGHLKPVEVDQDSANLWYCYYELPQGTLELEVFYDRFRDEWDVAVTQFPVEV